MVGARVLCRAARGGVMASRTALQSNTAWYFAVLSHWFCCWARRWLCTQKPWQLTVLHQSNSCLWHIQPRMQRKSPGTLYGNGEDHVSRKVKVEAAVVWDLVGLHSKKDPAEYWYFFSCRLHKKAEGSLTGGIFLIGFDIHLTCGPYWWRGDLGLVPVLPPLWEVAFFLRPLFSHCDPPAPPSQ